ncbi:hypothetical protein J5J83_11070 [Azoarcus sp. L1K30]|uniref:c-type cytochrome n=1 Tax=Azoarcus sp. L1K30 TaxID=2820277 RepID=UPI001B81551E|nr:hypothetical protein [Azoarcus sp. L1K30]MBR0566655.1 hypothetical protein [Azoarcus sp. L1K30]
MNGLTWKAGLLAVGVLCATTAAFAEGRDDDSEGASESGYTVSSRLEKKVRTSSKQDKSSLAAASTSSSAGTSAGSAIVGHPGRLLASNCFQCHGTDGRNGGFDSLAGESSREIIGELTEMRSKYEDDKGIMRVHAFGYSDEQLRLLADYFANVGR